MIGDGLNDTLALQAADAGVVMAGGVLAGLKAGDAVLVEPSALAMKQLWQLAKSSRRRLRTALSWAVFYNVIGVIAVVLGWWGPLVCAIAMPVSSILVVAYVFSWRPNTVE